MRRLFIAANWKMNTIRQEATELIRGIKDRMGSVSAVDIMVAPPFTVLESVGRELLNTRIQLGAQDVYFEKSGAYTGEISPGMLVDAGCTYVIIGHSERRQYFAENDEMVNKKVMAGLKSYLVPILCVGESWEERKQGKTFFVLNQQILFGLQGIDNHDLSSLVIAYEPVWAIGTGKSATIEQAQEVHAYLRNVIQEFSSREVAEAVRILYGGSMNPNNARDLLSQRDVDGGLIGGASLKAETFSTLVEIAEEVQRWKHHE
ncbi:MAG: triose-phosphate isomerase [Candidatus Atribacteria bacterium]|nr:triose-phosphate isomerase [Candidatus Atribacteria bacterium]